MTNIRRFPRQDERFDQASVWIARLDRGLTDEETAELQSWMAEDPDNNVALLSMAELWDNMDALSRLRDLFPVPVTHRQRLWPYGLGIAATVMIAAVLGLWAGFGSAPQGVYETAIGEQSTVTLSDGSVVVLNTNSRLRVDYTAEHRLLTLERGEINVRVARDVSRPFSVIAKDQEMQAVGTVFNVEITDDQKIELVVTEGKVRVSVRKPVGEAPPERVRRDVSAAESVVVSAGEELILGEAEEQITPVSPEEIEVKLSWRSGDLIFRGEPLEEAVREVGRYTAVEFVILDDNLRQKRVAGLFKAGDVDGLLETLRENFDIVYERVDERTVLLDSR